MTTRDKESEIFPPGEPPAAAQPASELLRERLWLRVKQWREQAEADKAAAKDERKHVFRAAHQVSADMHEGFANGLACDLDDASLQPAAAAPPIDLEAVRAVKAAWLAAETRKSYMSFAEEWSADLIAEVARLRALQGTTTEDSETRGDGFPGSAAVGSTAPTDKG